MMLKRLEISGFKSFAKRSTLEFSAPITAIVGPNGSGKSNVVEAIRFVLGEQSMKSLRGKSGSDLIWKGSKQLQKGSRASVSLVFDNADRVFKLTNEEGTLIPLDFDEITVTREVFTDGTGEYQVQGEAVRLRDIHEMIAHLNIGASGHHIISQGEADRLLHARPGERKEMLEESLGLRLYHYRIKESERKLEKTEDHLREVESAHRELLPHAKFLKKQVEKIEKAQEVAESLKTTFGTYAGNLRTFLHTEKEKLDRELGQAKEKVSELADAMASMKSDGEHPDIEKKDREIASHRDHIAKKRSELDDIERQLGRIEGMLEVVEDVPQTGQSVSVDDVVAFLDDLDRQLTGLAAQNVSVHDIVHAYRKKREEWVAGRKSGGTKKVEVPDHASLHETKKHLEGKKQTVISGITGDEQAIEALNGDIHTLRESIRQGERAYYEQAEERARESQRVAQIEYSLRDLEKMEELYREDAREVETLLGIEITSQPSGEFHDKEWFEKERHTIEKLKIRLEDLGGGGGGDIMKEYTETEERIQFLGREIDDLDRAKKDLRVLIDDLEEELEKEFKTGIKKVNSAFEEYFTLMFGGGSAKIDEVTISKKPKNNESEEGEVTPEETGDIERGIEIDVSLPRKKVKDLDMLSGGERSLTSIALLFALSQVNPPPFLVLDETDAALDEANSRKYGDVLERLSEETQLIVVTHNRETMSRAQILYGVTLGLDDASTLLSVKFDEAVKVAK